MKIAGELISSRLKSRTILKRKPHLKLMPNHFKDEGPTIKRLWNHGTAVRDGNGWYRSKRLKLTKKKKDNSEKYDTRAPLFKNIKILSGKAS